MAWQSSLAAWVAAAPAREQRAMGRLGAIGQTVARAHARIRTGRMREQLAWSSRLDQLEAGAPYTPYHEFGTRHIRAHPMLAPAADTIAAATPEAFDREFD